MRTPIAIVVACLLLCTQGEAADFVVTTVVDGAEAPGTVGDGICDVGGQCTLRAAVQEANATMTLDTITIPAGTYVLSVADAADASTDLDLQFPVTITGAGPLATIIDGGGTRGVLEVLDAATISGLTIRGGGQEFNGGGVYFAANPGVELVMRDVQITGNSASEGGGLYVDGGSIATLERVSITGNTGTVAGGAIEIGDSSGGGSVTLRNSTVSGNASGLLGGIVTGMAGDTCTLDHVTLVGATIGGGGTTTVVGSILDAGTGGVVCGGSGTFVSQGTNLEHGTSCGFGMTGDRSGVDPDLGPLQDNGGGTLTHALPATSPAVDAGGACALGEDQRGRPRPLDGDSNGTAACDVGAYELDPGDATTTTTTTSPTTTTLPGGCPSASSFPRVRCLVDALTERIGQSGVAGAFRQRLVASLGKVRDRVNVADGAAPSNARRAKKLLAKASALVRKARAKIGSKKGQKTFPDATQRGALQTDADAIRSAISTLAGALS